MNHSRRWLIGLLGIMVLTACGVNQPLASTPTFSPPSIPASTSFAPTAARAPLSSATIAVRIVPTLPPIIVTNPLPTTTPWPTLPLPTESIVIQPTITARPTPTPLICATMPSPIMLETQAAIQHFEHGLLFWLRTKNEIWALINSPTSGKYYWRVLPNLWYEGMPEDDPSITPPPKRYRPVRGFGYAWREGGGLASPPLRDDLGWAVDEEIGFDTTLTYYPQGFYSPDCIWEPKSGVYEMTDNKGVHYQFVGAGGQAIIITPTP